MYILGYIYKITNTVNGKVYIGKTEQEPKSRWSDHYKNSLHPEKNPYPLYLAMNKYKRENFIFEVIETVTEDMGVTLNDEEIRFIAEYHSYIHDPKCNGYNATIGGDGGSLISVEEGKAIIEAYKRTPILRQVCKQFNRHYITVRNILEINNIPILSNKEVSNRFYRRKVAVYNQENNLVAVYPCTSITAQQIIPKGNESNIINCCNGATEFAYGYKFEYTEQELYNEKEFLPRIKISRHNYKRRVLKIDPLTNKILEEYPSMAAAARGINQNRHAVEQIKKAANLHKEQYGFLWEIKEN